MPLLQGNVPALALARAQVVGRLMELLLDQVDFGRVDDEHREELRRLCASLLPEATTPAIERQLGGKQGVDELLDELSRDLVSTSAFLCMLQHPDVSDVLVNGPRQVYVERRGRLEPAALAFPDDDTLARMALWMTARVGRPIGEDRPMVDARLPDGSRLNAVIPPLSMDGVVLSVRRFRHRGLDLSGLAASSAFPLPFADLLAGMVACRLNVLICGGTGSGKTTMMNALSAYVGEHERVITIEDSAELVLRKAHVVRLETRLPDPSGKGEVTTRALVRNALRMRPDRILVGEVRGPEALDMLQAMNTGHEGSMSTIHANSPRDALDRLGTMVAMSDAALSDRAVRAQIGRSIDAIIHVRRLPDGRRVVDRITEVGQLQGDVIATQDILRFDYAGEDGQGRSLGAFVATGVRPAFADRIERRGVHLSSELWRLQMPIR